MELQDDARQIFEPHVGFNRVFVVACYLCVSAQSVCEGVCVVVLQQLLLQVVVTELGPAGSSLLCAVSRAPDTGSVHHHDGG